MQTVMASEFKSKCLSFINEASAGEEIVVTKNGKPMARLIPYEEKPKRRSLAEIQAFWADKMDFIDDIVGPMPESWYARDYSDDHLYD